MEPPQKKHRTSTFASPAAPNQMNPPIHGMRPPIQGMKPPMRPPQQMVKTQNPAQHRPIQGIGLPPQLVQQQPDQTDDKWKSKASQAAAQLNQSLVGTGTFTPQGAGPTPMADGSVLYTRDIFNVPSDRVGLLIGKGGSKIREIQERSGARMDIEKYSDPATPTIRAVTLSGNKEQIAAARAIIDALITNSAGLGFRPGSHNPPLNPSKTIQIPSSTVGLVIGRGGDNIRKIIQETSCTIHIEKDAEAQKAGRTPPQPGYQNVYFKGTDEAVEKAENAVMELVTGDRTRRRMPLSPAYGQQFGQFMIPQYQQPYGILGAQQIYGLQQQYVMPGQQIIQPTYAVMPGYAPTQQYAPQTYVTAPTYSPSTVGLTPQYAGYQTAQYQMATSQPSNVGVAPTTQVLTSFPPQFNQAQWPGSAPPGPPPQPQGVGQEPQSSPPQPIKSEQNREQTQTTTTMVYSPGGGAPTSPPNLANLTPSTANSVFLQNQQLSQIAGAQRLPGGGTASTQISQLSGQYKGVGVSFQPTSLPYNGIPTNAQYQQFGGTQNYTATGQSVIYNPQDQAARTANG